MKIAVISSHTPSLFWFRMDMMHCFQELGCDVVAIGNEAEAEWTEKFKKEGIRYIQAKIIRDGTNPLNDVATFFSLYSVIRREKPDKIFTYQAKTVIYGGIAAFLQGIKDVYPLIAGLGSVFLQKGKKAKLLQTILKIEYRVALSFARKVFFQNTDDISFFTANKLVSADKTVLINGSGVNLKKFTPSPLPESPVFLCISRLIRDKGVIEYLEAAKAVKKDNPSVRFLLVGPYDTNPSAIKPEDLQPYLDEGIVEYFGEQSDVRPFIAQSGIYVLPSYREGTPKTILEAMACGRAVITTDAPGCKETVTNGVNGLLVPVKNIKVLKDKMLELIDNPEAVKQMGAKGLSIAEEKYDVRIVNSAICDTMGIRRNNVNISI